MKYQILSLLMLTTLLFSCSRTSSNTKERDLTKQQIDSLFHFAHANGMFNGSVLITKNDSLIYQASFGFANKEKEEEFSQESLFYIASISKQMTAMGIMILQEQGRLSYDDKVVKFFPDFPKYLHAISIRQLLNHTSGLTDRAYYQLESPSNQDVRNVLLEQDSLELINGETFRYSNSGFVLLALIIEQVSREPIEDFFDQEIFIPLEMKNTTAKRSMAQSSPNMVEGYNFSGKKVGYQSSVVGPGGIYSTIDDLARWNRALNSNLLVSKKTLSEAFTNGQLNDKPISIMLRTQEYGYGFGWMVFEKNGQKYVQHDGTVEAYRSMIKKNLSKGYDYIYLTNDGARLAANELLTSIDNILDSAIYKVPLIPLTTKIVTEFQDNDLQLASANLQAIAKRGGGSYTINEQGVNRLAYSYLKEKKVTVALEVFKLNVILHPSSANAFDSLAEGYFSNEEFALSLKNYQKSLVLNPSNENAKERISQLKEMIN